MAVNLRRAIARRIDRGFFEGVEKNDGLWAGQFRAYGVDGVAFDARDEDDSTPNRIVGVADPIGDYDAANKKYVDALHQGLVWKEPVRVAHDTLNVASPGSTIDGVSMAVGDRVLRMSQSGHKDNGIWIWQGASVPMVRATDADGSDPDGKSELRSGTLVPVQEGTKYGDTVWWLVSPDTPVVIGTTPTEWRQFKSAGDLTAGSYIQISGNEISVRVGAGLTSSGGNLVPNFTASGSDNGTSTAVARGDHKHDSLYKDISWVPSWDNVTNKPQGLVNLAAKAAESGTSGFLKKTGQNTWTLDATTYATASALSSHTNASNPHSGSAPLNSPVFTGTPVLPTTTKLGSVVLDDVLANKADKADTLSGYGITDAVTVSDFMAHVNKSSGAHAASAISVTAIPNVPGNNVQAVLAELKGQIDGKTSNTGTVTSVGLSLPTSIFSVSGSPVNTSGTLTGTLKTQAPHFVLAGPGSGTSNAAPTFRELVPSDIPILNQDTTGKAGRVANALEFSSAGDGGASSSTYDGSAARKISYNSIGAAPLTSPVFAGTPELPTTTKLGTSVLQTLINGKAAVGHTHSIVAGDGLHGGGSVGQSAITLHVDLATDSGLEFTSTDKKLKVLFGGSGGDHGSSNTVARSNHDHSLVKGLKSGFEINGIATSTNVTAHTLSLLTDNGVGDGEIDYISDMHEHACQIVYVGVAAESITFGDPVFFNPQGEVRRSAANDESRGYVVGISLGNYPTGAHVYAAVAGFVKDVGDVGENFLGVAGGLDTVPPSDPDHRVIRVGMGVPGGLVIQINDFGA